MKFDYNNKTNEYVCPECGENYKQYNSLFKHYQRTHPTARNNDNNDDDKTAIVIDSSRTNSLTARNNDNNDDDKTVTVIENNDKNSDKRVTVKKNNDKTAFHLVLFIIGIALIGILYKKGFFSPLLGGFGLVTQKQRSIFK